MTKHHSRLSPSDVQLSKSIFFRPDHISFRHAHRHFAGSWGEFRYSFFGFVDVKVGVQEFLAPPHMGIWIPPGRLPLTANGDEKVYCSVYISKEMCSDLPAAICALLVSPLVRGFLKHLSSEAEADAPPERERLLKVLVDQLSNCEAKGSFIPYSDDRLLSEILGELQRNPADNRSLSELAQVFGVSERTLMRRSQSELGISLTEWRQRLRVICALPLLRAGWTVEDVAYKLGYATSSSFIAMFRRATGASPGRLIAENSE